MPEANIIQVMQAYKEWKDSQDLIVDDDPIPFEPCACPPEFGTEVE